VSRGPGFWQRAILASFDRAESFYLVDVLPDDYTKSQYNAANRAAQRLYDRDLISMWHFTFGTPHVVIARPGAVQPDRRQIESARRARAVNCWSGGNVRTGQHLTVSGGVRADLHEGQHLSPRELVRFEWRSAARLTETRPDPVDRALTFTGLAAEMRDLFGGAA
jgi:hypothetical protein